MLEVCKAKRAKWSQRLREARWRGSVGLLGGLRGASWRPFGVLGGLLGPLGDFLGVLGGFLAALGSLMGPIWASVG